MIDVKAVATEYALELGFDLVRVTSAQEFTQDRAVTLERLRAGLMDGLPWFNEARVQRGTDPSALLTGARSIICLGLSYFQHTGDGPKDPRPLGRVALYAWGRDYHKVMKKMMRNYVQGLRLRLGSEFMARWYVDDGPMLDRAAANRAGLGWFGKNTNLLTSSHGSWVFLGQVVTDLELEPDPPLKKTCGGCVRCIDACPTGAIVAPYTIDNTRCISYLTIENRGEIPLELRSQMGDWVFGCDICQDVCPVNRRTGPSSSPWWQRDQVSSDPNWQTGQQTLPGKETPAALDLIELLEMSEEEFRRRFQGTAILRAKRVGLQRNACVALGNLGAAEAVPVLCRVLVHGEPLVRGHAAWALGRIGSIEAQMALERASEGEADPWVLKELAQAMDHIKA
jgi:epoxyqueuosine reductase